MLVLAVLPALAASVICVFLTRLQLLQSSSFAQQGHSKTRLKYTECIYTPAGFQDCKNEVQEQNTHRLEY